MLTQPLDEAPVDQRLVDIGSPFVAYLQMPVAVQPRQRALHYPPMPPQLLAASLPFLDIRLLMLGLPRAFRHFFTS
jgi:hypothetical protein